MAQALAVFRAALGAPGAGLDASCFRAVASVLDAAGDWQQAVSIFEVMAARVGPAAALCSHKQTAFAVVWDRDCLAHRCCAAGPTGDARNEFRSAVSLLRSGCASH